MIESSKGRTCHLAFFRFLEESGDTASAIGYLVDCVQVEPPEHANMMHMPLVPFPIGLSPPRGRGVAPCPGPARGDRLER